MDSMRHLSTSLPGASSRQRNTDEPTSDILGDFKAAALSVTNLYKTAARSQERARGAGYQDALDDLLAFLDKENLGLMDGEGWRVRQWATERLEGERPAPRQGTETSSTTADDEDDGSTAKDDDKDDERSSSPEVQRKPPHHPLVNSSSDLTEDHAALPHRRVVSEPPQQQQYTPLQGDFTFQSSHAYPSNHDRDMELDNNSTPPQQSTASSNASSTETVRIIPRSSGRNATRHHKRNNNAETRLPTLNFNLGTGAGSKRKLPYQDFFDISGVNEGGDRKDGGGGNNGSGRGGKRGRHV
ncbi:Hypothetical predicted protein [Lecanosticta acicola]|uniref:Uncharacterized protein n=1 Tax=Lecanosticta acicola TaxID=111012 RepID=A0AAI8Z4Z7_9PEZI|nr:Hypothetical predicted protein [Lecanosticta acicola]